MYNEKFKQILKKVKLSECINKKVITYLRK